MRRRLQICAALIVLAVVWLTATRSVGDPWRSTLQLLLVVVFAFAAGWMYEVLRKGGTLDLDEQLRDIRRASRATKARSR